MKKLLTMLIAAFAIASINVSATTAKLYKASAETGVLLNGDEAIIVHCNFEITGSIGKPSTLCVFIKDSAGNWHKVNSQYVTRTGIPFFKKPIEQRLDFYEYADFPIPIYVKDLALSPGVNTYQIIATILDYDGNIIAGCEGSTFIANGQSVSIKPQDNEQ